MKTQAPEALTTNVTQIMSLLGEHDAATLRHSWRVSRLARAMAVETGAPPAVCRAAGLAGLLHDVGKLTVPTALINKPTALSAAEARLMGSHALSGARMVRTFAHPEIAEVLALHHARVDQVPSLSWLTRLVSVADTYDALVYDRPYRPGCTPTTAAQELRRVAGTQLDIDLVTVVLATIGSSCHDEAAAA
jgi:two-component system cell cycle response regulator